MEGKIEGAEDTIWENKLVVTFFIQISSKCGRKEEKEILTTSSDQ